MSRPVRPGDRPNHFRICLTGGPGGGKTTAADLFRREIGEEVVVVPEAATMLFSGGFPRSSEPLAREAAQRAIFHVQRNLEDLQAARYPGRILLCDRGTVDGAAYWPAGRGDFFSAMGTTRAEQLQRYDAVVFFESAAAGGVEVMESNNPWRKEGVDEARELDRALRALWSDHPRFQLVPHNPSFFKKIVAGLAAIESIVARLRQEEGRAE
ncbi:MAG: hypothetical protein D6798_01250 [Deltaproteobacteria bacterium]|nr:MAG: hypothetical protein D6798_01250 [Deltaproteobacteria bacterium]